MHQKHNAPYYLHLNRINWTYYLLIKCIFANFRKKAEKKAVELGVVSKFLSMNRIKMDLADKDNIPRKFIT